MKPNLIEMQIQRHHLNAGNNPRKARRCPVCNETELFVIERQGVEIDTCPRCRGVWLDRGELDRIVERSIPSLTETRIHDAPIPAYKADNDHCRQETDHTGLKGHNVQRRSWLMKIFS